MHTMRRLPAERLAVCQFHCNDALLPHIQPACLAQDAQEIFADGCHRASVKGADARCGWPTDHDRNTGESERDNGANGDTYYSKLTELRIKQSFEDVNCFAKTQKLGI